MRTPRPPLRRGTDVDARRHGQNSADRMTSSSDLAESRPDPESSANPVRAMLRSFRARIVSMPFSAVAGLVMSAFIIDEAGPDAYGYVILVATLFFLLPFAEMGVQAAVTNAIADSTDPTSDDHVSRVLVTSLRTLCVSAVTVIAVAVLLGVTGMWAQLLSIPLDVYPDANTVVAASVCIYAAGLPATIGLAILWGLGRNEIAVLLSVITPVAALVICVLLRHAGVAPLWYSIAQPAGLGLCAIVTTLVAARVGGFHPARWLTVLPMRRSFPGVPIRTRAGPALVVLVALPFIIQSDRFIVSHRGTPEQLASLALAAQLYMPLWTVAYTAGQPLWPQFSRRRNAGGDLWSLWRRSTMALALLGVVMGTGMVLLGPPVAGLVGGDAVVVSTALFGALALLLLVQASHMPAWMGLTTPTGLRFHAGCVVAAVVLKLSLAWTITPYLGALGPVAASILAIGLCMFVPGVWAMHRRLAG